MKPAQVASYEADSQATEWAYIPPNRPDGLGMGDLHIAEMQAQSDTARFWFLLNYEPFPPVGEVWPGYRSSAGGYGVAMGYALSSWPARELLWDEFENFIPQAVLGPLGDHFAAISERWTTSAPPSAVTPISTPATLEATLLKLTSVLADLVENRARVGHNHGPPLIDTPLDAEISEAVRLGLDATDKVPKVDQATRAVDALQRVFSRLGSGVLDGFTRTAGASLYAAAFWATCQLLPYLHDAIVALRHWIEAVGAAGIPGAG